MALLSIGRFAAAQLDDAAAIKRLRSLHVPLDEIRIIRSLDDDGLVRERLDLHRERLRERVAATEAILAELHVLIDGKEPLVPDRADVLYRMDVRDYPDQSVLSIRERARADELKRVIPAAYRELFAYLRELGEEAVEPWTITICPFADENDVVEVENAVVTASLLDGRGRIQPRVLPACTAVALEHRGPYERLHVAYRALQDWFAWHGVDSAGDPREIYVTDPEEVPDPADYVTVVAWPIPPEQAERARGSGEKFQRPLPAPSG